MPEVLSQVDPVWWWLLGVLIAVLLLALVFWPRQPSFAAKPLLTKNELEFYGRLQRALPDLAIFPQVALRAFIRPRSPSHSKLYRRESSLLGAKHCDFLICEPTTLEIITIIELDDASHDLDKDAVRDAMTASAGYPTLRWHSRHKPSEADIREAVQRLRA